MRSIGASYSATAHEMETATKHAIGYEVSGLELTHHTGLKIYEGDTISDPGGLAALFRANPYGFIVLWRVSLDPEAGHWTFMVGTGPRRLLYMDSYGLAPGDESKFGAMSNDFIKSQVAAGGWAVDKPARMIQEPSHLVNTCGRYTLSIALYARAALQAGRTPTIAGWMQATGLSYLSWGSRPDADDAIVADTRQALGQ